MPGCPSRVTRVGIRPTYHFQGNRYEDTIGTVLTEFFAAFLWAEFRGDATGGGVGARLYRIIRCAANYLGICIMEVFICFSEIAWPFLPNNSVVLTIKFTNHNRYSAMHIICKWNRETFFSRSVRYGLEHAERFFAYKVHRIYSRKVAFFH